MILKSLQDSLPCSTITFGVPTTVWKNFSPSIFFCFILSSFLVSQFLSYFLSTYFLYTRFYGRLLLMVHSSIITHSIQGQVPLSLILLKRNFSSPPLSLLQLPVSTAPCSPIAHQPLLYYSSSFFFLSSSTYSSFCFFLLLSASSCFLLFFRKGCLSFDVD